MIRRYKIPLQTRGYAETVRIPQYDTGYLIVFDVTDLPEGTETLDDYTAVVEGVRSDGLKYSFECAISGTTVSFEIDTTCTGFAGRGEARIRFLYASSGEEYASKKFLMDIEKSSVPDGAVDAEVSAAQEAADVVTGIINNARSDLQQTVDAELSSVRNSLSDIDGRVSAMRTATSEDVGKALLVKRIVNGEVIEWEFGEAGGESVAPEVIEEIVEDWLDAHPEATTTVPDNSLVIDKMVIGTLGYVTPEMFGAVGDGSTDDTSAFSQACNSGKPVVLTQGKTYKIDTVTVTSPLIIIGNFATVSTTASSSVKSTFIIRANAISATISDVNFTTTLGIDTTGAHGEAITNRSMRTCIASYGIEKLSVVNCNIENFDNGIIGMTQSTDTEYASVPEHLYVKDTRITNCLMGISRHYKNVVIDGCYIQVDTNAQSGEHCIYLLSDVLSNAYITNTTLITDGSSAGACVNIRPRTGEAGANLVDGVYRIDGCTMIGDGYVHVHGGGKCYVTSCTLKTVNYNTTAKMRQFACPSTDDSVIDVSGCSVNLELQDGLTERVIYRGCDVYTNGAFSTRFALYKAYDCQFDNIGINVAEGAEIVGCMFSSSSGVAGKYYVLVGSTITTSTIIRCVFNTGVNVTSIAYNSTGKCLLVAVISSLPNGNNITGLTFYHKVDPTQSDSGGTDTGMSIVNGQLCVTYAE